MARVRGEFSIVGELTSGGYERKTFKSSFFEILRAKKAFHLSKYDAIPPHIFCA